MPWYKVTFNGQTDCRYEADSMEEARQDLLVAREKNKMTVLAYDNADVFIDWHNIATMMITPMDDEPAGWQAPV